MELCNTITNILMNSFLDVVMICGIVIICVYTVEVIKQIVASANKRIKEINSGND